jgi:hypothetical protein
MQPDDHDGADETPPTTTQSQPNRVKDLFSDLFSIPRPVKNLFDTFPILTYPPNELPQRASRISAQPSLYVFCTEQDAIAGRPSFNPGCLKWQVSNVLPLIDRVKC